MYAVIHDWQENLRFVSCNTTAHFLLIEVRKQTVHQEQRKYPLEKSIPFTELDMVRNIGWYERRFETDGAERKCGG